MSLCPNFRRRSIRSAAAFLVSVCLCNVALADAPRQSESQIIAFVHVNVVPMDSDRTLPDQTVLIEHAKIAAIGSALTVPAGARIIDGHGNAYLSPGLADMHTHSDTSEDMKVYLANGVTSVLNMGHASEDFMTHVRPRINNGRLPGPHIYAGFLVDGSPQFGNFYVDTPAEARAIVDIAKTNGYDYIKVYNDLSPACFKAIIKESKRLHISVIGHGVTRVGIEKQLAMGQIMVAHTEEFLYTVFSHPDLSLPNPAIANPTPPKVEDIPRVISFIKHDKAFVTADLNTYTTMARQWGKPEVLDGYMHSPELRYLSPRWRINWLGSGYAGHKGSIDANLAFLRVFTKDMADAGVPLLTGTDAPTIPGLFPGYSLHDDMDTLEAAGLSRYQVLMAATRIPGKFIRRSIPGAEKFGTVTVGSRADLVLSTANPLDDLSVLRRPLGVMADGKWYSRNALQVLLEGVSKEYAKAISVIPN